jgi:hypothetical protein
VSVCVAEFLAFDYSLTESTKLNSFLFVLLPFIFYFLTYKIPTFKVSPMKIIKRFCNRQSVTVVLVAVYLNYTFTETVIEYDKYILNNTVG